MKPEINQNAPILVTPVSKSSFLEAGMIGHTKNGDECVFNEDGSWSYVEDKNLNRMKINDSDVVLSNDGAITENELLEFTKKVFEGNKSKNRFLIFYGTKKKFKQFLGKLK